MKSESPNSGYEPVPQMSQLLALSFLSSLAGILKGNVDLQFKCTLHRVMTRAGRTYLQQVCDYMPMVQGRAGSGLIYGVETGITGRAFFTARTWRTKGFPTEESLEAALTGDIKATADNRPLDDVGRSWLAIPLLDRGGHPVLIFFAESDIVNYFADDDVVRGITHACNGFCDLLNILARGKFPIARNQAMELGKLAKRVDTAYPNLQEEFPEPVATRLDFDSFNFGG